MPRWVGYERLVQRGAEITGKPKPPWWKPLERMKWRERCTTAAIHAVVEIPPAPTPLVPMRSLDELAERHKAG